MISALSTTTWPQWAAKKLNDIGSPYADLLTTSLELQIIPTDDDDLRDRYSDWAIVGGPHRLRIPATGDTSPTNNVGPVSFHPELVARFGTSYWNWRDQLSLACFIDFDFGHGPSGLDERQIQYVDELASRHNAIMNVTSRGGKGRHWLIQLAEPLPAPTRSDHKSNCDAIVAQVCRDLATDLHPFICTYGAIQYLYDAHAAIDGFQLVKRATDKLALAAPVEILAAETHQRTRFRGATTAQQRCLEAEQVAQHVELDDTHKAIIETMQQHGWPVVIDQHNGQTMLRLHTAGLALDHRVNNRPGIFATDSDGTDPGTPNSYAFLRPHGGLAVRRYGTTSEADCWHAGPSGIMSIDYNVPPTYDQACRHFGGKKDRRDNYVMAADDARQALSMLGTQLDVPELLASRPVTIKRDGELLRLTIAGETSEKSANLPGWRYHRGQWEHDLGVEAEKLPTHDDRIRHTTKSGDGQSWYVLDARGEWVTQPLSAVKMYLEGCGHGRQHTAEIIKSHIDRNWTITRIPFAGEYPRGNRIWNRDGARLSCDPQPGDWSHWRMILEHCGRGIDEEVKADPWCQTHGIKTGADWLMVWAAVMVRHPEWRLPYLFLFSEQQETGKSALHRALTRLFEGTNGWAELRKELTRDDFNDAMIGAALLILEEIDLSQNYSTYTLLKNYIDSPSLKIRGIYSKSETETNYSHFIHTANHAHFCPVYPNDSRIVVIPVDKYEGDDLPWTTTLCPRLDAECPAFLDALLSLQLPQHGCGRLHLPVLETQLKRELMSDRADELRGWYAQLRELAIAGEINNLTASQILKKLDESTTDPKIPKSAAGLASQLARLGPRLERDGLAMTIRDGDKKTSSTYTIKVVDDRGHS